LKENYQEKPIVKVICMGFCTSEMIGNFFYKETVPFISNFMIEMTHLTTIKNQKN
jgi:hypothetical protein